MAEAVVAVTPSVSPFELCDDCSVRMLWEQEVAERPFALQLENG